MRRLIRKLLCWLGFHDPNRGACYQYYQQRAFLKCMDCGRAYSRHISEFDFRGIK